MDAVLSFGRLNLLLCLSLTHTTIETLTLGPLAIWLGPSNSYQESGMIIIKGDQNEPTNNEIRVFSNGHGHKNIVWKLIGEGKRRESGQEQCRITNWGRRITD